MKVRLRYFASVREAIGRAAEERATGAGSLADLRRELVALGAPYDEALAPGKAVRMALDQVMADEATPLREGCEVAFFPPVTGG